MFEPSKLFENPFDETRITNSRLANFFGDHLERLAAQNGNHAFAALIAQLTPSYTALQTEVDNVDVALTIQKGKTLTVDKVIAGFKKTMSAKHGVIADVLGGLGTPACLEFYPRGTGEYSRASKSGLPVLISRVHTSATTHAAALGADLTQLLQSYYTGWQASRKAQQAQKGNVSDNRASRSAARQAAEISLVFSVHAIGQKYPGDITKCLSFYNFSLLSAVPARRKIQTISGTIAASNTSVALNRSFTPGSRLKVLNTSDNASLFIYIAPTPATAMNGHGTEIKAGKSVNLAAADIGNLSDTFLLIRNLNEINNVNYVVELKS